MNYTQFISILKQKIGLMVLVGLLLAALVFWGTMLISPRYQSNFDVLIVQNQEGFMDSYTLAKSTEYFSKVLSEGIYTEAFLNKVLEAYPELFKTLPISRVEKMKSWGKMVRINRDVELGMIGIKVLANSNVQAEKVSKTIADVLANDNKMFISENQNIEVRMINSPVVKSNPGAAMLTLSVAAAFFIGFLTVFAFLFYGNIFRGENISKFENINDRDIWGESRAKDSLGNVVDSETGNIIGRL